MPPGTPTMHQVEELVGTGAHPLHVRDTDERAGTSAAAAFVRHAAVTSSDPRRKH
jgi:hypothetical protein